MTKEFPQNAMYIVKAMRDDSKIDEFVGLGTLQSPLIRKSEIDHRRNVGLHKKQNSRIGSLPKCNKATMRRSANLSFAKQ